MWGSDVLVMKTVVVLATLVWGAMLVGGTGEWSEDAEDLGKL